MLFSPTPTLVFALLSSLFLLFPTHARTPRHRRGAITVKTSLGSVSGAAALTGGGTRFSVRYGTVAQRWDQSTVVSAWTSTIDGTAMPASCPQDDGYSSGTSYSEDCLYQVVYIPAGAKNLPVMVWIHGGSFVAGSASAPGLDGSAFAEKNQVVVVVLQYRLGVLGLLPPADLISGSTNLAVQDVINALSFIQTTIASFGGDPTKVTVAGQSSGGQMIRALLTSPKTTKLFRAAILQSDPMDYGMSSPATTSILTSAFYSTLASYGATTLAQLRALDIDTIRSVQTPFVSGAFTFDESIPLAAPIRPTFGDAILPYDFAQGLTSGQLSASRPVLFTTVKDELGTTVGGLAPEPIDEDTYEYYVTLFAPNVAKQNAILASSSYAVGSGTDAARIALLKLGTESIWACAVRGVADLWRKQGGIVYVAEFEQGISYGNNPYIPFCSGLVCHEDDIYLVFGTGGSTTVGTEVNARWGNFVKTLSPNPSEYATWSTYSSASNILALGGTANTRSCPANFWGVSPTFFDWQLYSAGSTTSVVTTKSATPTATSSRMVTSIRSSTTSTFAAASATAIPPSNGYISRGCVADSQSAYLLQDFSFSSSSMTPGLCTSTCKSKGFAYAGIEYGVQCMCGSSLKTSGGGGGVSAACTTACAGGTGTCGGFYAMNLYYAAPAGWSTGTCLTDDGARLLTGASLTSDSMTPAMCQNFCAGYTFSGTEYSTQCYCGNSIAATSSHGQASTACLSTCGGDVSVACGGSYAITVYAKTAPKWNFTTCVADGTPRLLSAYSTSSSSMTNTLCQSTCKSRNYIYAATEYSTQCYCGNALATSSTVGTPSSSCDYPCAGDSTQTCGGSYAASLSSYA